ncbi:unnamed protein product [Pocillopora meandrina]|uniref:G-protein coupled receptors family 1 profile domain-containing protein n=1 Tax=Pocillopora meandrina TaxID=46732 RepID=A0AAU9WCZ2_9CNID|nr:unnamed protein product [Pocillopora meandrina]
MSDLYCYQSLYFPSLAELNVLRGTFIANCILNGFLTHTAIMLNIVTIYAIWKTSTIPKPVKTLLLSLAFSDFGVGLLAQPIYTAFLVSWLQLNDPSCNVYRLFSICGYLFSMASFSAVVAVSVDRFLAVHLHLRYHEFVTHKRVVAVVISIWLFSAFVSSMVLWASVSTLNNMISFTGAFFFFCKCCDVHQDLFNLNDGSQSGEMTNFASLIKSTVGVFYVYLVFLICYLPYSISVVAIKINGPSIAFKKVFLFSMIFVNLNSSLNPVLYCWKMRNIRHAFLHILRNMSWNRNNPSH